jgi:UDP-glucuronate decarboxylase
MKKILVTGGAGFLGSNLCKRLLTEGNFVYCLDNLYTGRIENIENIITNANFRFINHDVREYIDIDVDEIYNLACPASPKNYQKDPIFTIMTNVMGSKNMLDLARKYDAKILQASTSEIYGNPSVHPQNEDYYGNVNINGIRSCYDEGKRLAETLFTDYNRLHKVKIKIIRIFNTYGPNMEYNDGRVVSNFIVQSLKNENITIYGNGKQTRSFCYVDDLINGMLLMMNSSDDFIGPVNIGNSEEFTIEDLAKKMKEQEKEGDKPEEKKDK